MARDARLTPTQRDHAVPTKPAPVRRHVTPALAPPWTGLQVPVRPRSGTASTCPDLSARSRAPSEASFGTAGARPTPPGIREPAREFLHHPAPLPDVRGQQRAGHQPSAHPRSPLRQPGDPGEPAASLNVGPAGPTFDQQPAPSHAPAVLFDLDGTLVDSFALIAASFAYAVREVLGREPTEEELYRRWGAPLRVRAHEVAPDRTEELVTAYERYYDARHHELLRPFPGVPEMLRALRAKGACLAVVTSKRRRRALQTLSALALSDLFGCVVAEDDVRNPKPAADPLYRALQQLGVPRERAWLVGDAPLDILAARAAGVRAIAALWGTRERDALLALRPDYVATIPSDVLAAVFG